MSDAFENTMLYRRYKAQPGIPDKFADSTEATIAFDEVLTPLGLRRLCAALISLRPTI